MKTLISLILLLLISFTVEAQSIELKRGFGGYRFFQNGEKLKPYEVDKVMSTHPEALKLFRSARGHRSTGTVIGFAGGFMMGWTLGDLIWRDEEIDWRLLTAGFGLAVVSFSFDSAANRRTREAVDLYNSQLGTSFRQSNVLRFKLEASINKVGMVMSF